MIESKKWAVVGDAREPEAFIPVTPRSLAILEDALRRQRGEYTDEERAEMERYAAAEAAKRAAEQKRCLERHAHLLATAPHPIVLSLLIAHYPKAYGEGSDLTGYACHACPTYVDEDGDAVYQGWPCPTWALIDQEAP